MALESVLITMSAYNLPQNLVILNSDNIYFAHESALWSELNRITLSLFCSVSHMLA